MGGATTRQLGTTGATAHRTHRPRLYARRRAGLQRLLPLPQLPAPRGTTIGAMTTGRRCPLANNRQSRRCISRQRHGWQHILSHTRSRRQHRGRRHRPGRDPDHHLDRRPECRQQGCRCPCRVQRHRGRRRPQGHGRRLGRHRLRRCDHRLDRRRRRYAPRRPWDRFHPAASAVPRPSRISCRATFVGPWPCWPG